MPGCAAINCTNRQFRGCGKTFHLFPLSQPDLVDRWVRNMRRDKWRPSKKSVLCSDHFLEPCFDTTGQTTRLRPGAEPTVFDFPAGPQRSKKTRKKAAGRHGDSVPDVLRPETKRSVATPTHEEHSYGICDTPLAPLPLAALRLLVPPLRLLSAAMWRTVRQKAAAHYGMLEEFVSMVTDVVPELLARRQRTRLCLGLRAKVILEMCRPGAPADPEAVQPHLDRMQTLVQAWIAEAGGPNFDPPHSDFVDLVKNLLVRPGDRENFFQNVFHEEFGPRYDEELRALMWLFLSRLEKFLPLQSFELVASMFGEPPSVLEDCLQPVAHHAELKVLLQYHRKLGQPDHSDIYLEGSCIASALKLPSVEKSRNIPDAAPMNPPNVDGDPSDEDAHVDSKMPSDKLASETRPRRGAGPPAGGATRSRSGGARENEKAALTPSRRNSTRLPLKSCRVRLERLDLPPPSSARPVRRNRGLKMKRYLLEEKRRLDGGPRRESASFHPPLNATKKGNPRRIAKDSRDVGSPRRDDDSWSYCSDEGSGEEAFRSTSSLADSWSYYSSDQSSVTSHLGTSPDRAPPPARSGEDSFSADPAVVSPSGKDPDLPDAGAATPKKARELQCFICEERVSRSLKGHLKTHFPSGDFACPQCDRRFRSAATLTKHVRRTCFERLGPADPEDPVQAEDPHKCDKCRETFRYKASLRRHLLTHEELYCDVCRKVLQNAETLARHRASHTRFQCNRCEQSFAHFKLLLRHCQSAHRIGKPFQCERCPRSLRSLRLLIMHEWCHTGNQPFRCAACGLRVRSAAELAYHERVHTREKPYLCAECGKTFAHQSNLLRHLTLVHGEPAEARRHACPQCPKAFKEKAALKKHQRSKHLHELFRSPCQYCGKMIASSTAARHKLIHTGEKPFKCPECSLHFRSAAEAKRHALVRHSAERPYKCDVCEKGFVRMGYLKVHAKVHTGEKPYVCPICLKAFPKVYSMRRHKRLIHSFVTQ